MFVTQPEKNPGEQYADVNKNTATADLKRNFHAL